MSVTDIVLVESRTMRSQYTDQTDVLDKIGSLTLLPDDTHATTEMVARFYEVGVEAVKGVAHRNREELTHNGYRVLRGDDLKQFKAELHAATLSDLDAQALFKGVRSLALFNRKAILNVGMLLTESSVAREVRAYLLSGEEMLTEEQRHKAWVRARLNGVEARKSFTATLRVVYELSETSTSFGIWAANFTKMMTKAALKLDEAGFKALKAQGGGNAREAMTAEQLERMDMVEQLVSSYARLKDAESIKQLYSETKGLML